MWWYIEAACMEDVGDDLRPHKPPYDMFGGAIFEATRMVHAAVEADEEVDRGVHKDDGVRDRLYDAGLGSLSELPSQQLGGFQGPNQVTAY